MAGLHFIHGGFLAAGAALAIPILIHLLFRQKTRTVPIGSVRFLQQVVREHQRRRRLRQWILLALRVLGVVLLALLFARPYLDASLFFGNQQEVVFLVDRSASMLAKNASGQSAFSRALAQLKDDLSRLDDNVVVHCGLSDSCGVAELKVDQLAHAEPTHAATDFGLALHWARDILNRSRRATRILHFYSDLQRSGLARSTLAKLPDGVELVVHDVGDTMTQNVAVESAEAIHTEIRADRRVTVRLVLQNHSPIPLKKLPVHCELSGESRTVTTHGQVNLTPHGRASIDLPMEISEDGLYRGKAWVAFEDGMAVDDQRWLAFEARHPERVLLVDGQEGRTVFNNETYYLETALRLRSEEVGERLRSFEPDRLAWDSGVGFPNLDGYRVVVLANVRRLSDDDGARLESYFRTGGNLLVFAGDQTTRESLRPLEARGLLPGRIAANPIERRVRIDQWDASHPALIGFNDPQRGDLRRISFDTILPIEALGDQGRPLLQADNQVVLAEHPFEKGRCLYFGSTADREWTELARTPIFVPLVRELLAYLTDQLGNRSTIVRQFITKPGETLGIAPPSESNGRWQVTNIDPRESALARATTEELQEFAGTQAVRVEDEADQAAMKLVLPEDRLRPNENWTSVLWCLFIVLIVETFLAGRVHA